MDNRQIDVLVAEKVMGWGVHKRNTAWWVDKNEVDAVGGIPFAFTDEWKPSTDIAAAWQVVEKMNSIPLDGNEGYQIRAKFEFYIGPRLIVASAKEAAYHICLAALNAVGVEV